MSNIKLFGFCDCWQLLLTGCNRLVESVNRQPLDYFHRENEYISTRMTMCDFMLST